MKYFKLNTEDLPFNFDLIYNETVYNLAFRYNPYADYFTVDLADKKGIVVQGLKVMYGQDIFNNLHHLDNIPVVIPVDEYGEYHRVSYRTFNDIIFVIEDDYYE